MAKYRKPSGVLVDVSDSSADHAKSLGWEEVKSAPRKVPAKAKAKAKAKPKSKA